MITNKDINNIPSLKNKAPRSIILSTRVYETQAGVNTSGLLQRNTLLRESRDQIETLLDPTQNKSPESLRKERQSKKIIWEKAREGVSRKNSYDTGYDKGTFMSEKIIADKVLCDTIEIGRFFQHIDTIQKKLITSLNGNDIGLQYNGSHLLDIYKERFGKKEEKMQIPYVIYYGRIITLLAQIVGNNDIRKHRYETYTHSEWNENRLLAASNILSRYLNRQNPTKWNRNACKQLCELIHVRHHRIRNADKKFLKQLDYLFTKEFKQEKFINEIIHPLSQQRSTISEKMLSFFTEDNIQRYFKRPGQTNEQEWWPHLSKKITKYFSYVLTEEDIKKLEEHIQAKDLEIINTSLNAVLQRVAVFIRDTKDILENKPDLFSRKDHPRKKEFPLEMRLYHCAELYANFHLRERLGYLYKKNTSTDDRRIPYAPINPNIDPTDESVYDGIPYAPGLKPSE